MALTQGWRRLYDQARRFTRTLKNSGAVTDELLAWAFSEAEQKIAHMAIESGIPWAIRNKQIDDTNLGTIIALNAHFLFIETDLQIFDFAKVKRLFRVDAAQGFREEQIVHLDTMFSAASGVTAGSIISTLNVEAWIEDGDLNNATVPRQELAIRLYNKGQALDGGELKIQYWISPLEVDPDFFFEVDSNGVHTRFPSLPQPVWPAILNYALVISLEATEEVFKSNTLWKRLRGTDGILQDVRNYFATFQTDEVHYVEDTFQGEGIGGS